MAIKHDPTYSEAYFERGVCLCKLNRLEEALASFSMAIKHNPTEFAAYFSRGFCLKDLNRHEEALASYDMAIKHNLKNSMAFNNNRVVCLGQNDYLEESLRITVNRLEESLAKCDMAVKNLHNVISSALFNDKGDCFFKLNRLEEALASYDMAIKHNPNNAKALNSRKIILENLESK